MASNRTRHQPDGSAWHWKQTDCWYYHEHLFEGFLQFGYMFTILKWFDTASKQPNTKLAPR